MEQTCQCGDNCHRCQECGARKCECYCYFFEDEEDNDYKKTDYNDEEERTETDW